MKSLVTLLTATVLASLATSALAGETYVASKNVVAPEMKLSLYPDHEWTVDAFGTYAFTESTNERILGDHAFGGGLAVNYFFTKNIGLGIEGQALKNGSKQGDDTTGSAALNVFYRLPIGETGWAPYTYIGGGVIFNANDTNFREVVNEVTDNNDDSSDKALIEGHAGIGVEYRITRNFGVFTDGRWTVVEDKKNNFPSVRTGIRFAF